MANPLRVDLPVLFDFTSAVVGQIDCQGIGNGALLRLGQAAASGAATPEETVRRFLQRVGRKPDGSHPRGAPLTDEDVAAVSTAELEEFAEKTIVEEEYLTRELIGRDETGGPDGRPQSLYGDAFLEREEGESGIDFLARAVIKYSERRETSARSLLASMSGQSAIGSMRDIYSSAARLADQMGASHRAAASAAQALQARGTPPSGRELTGVISAEATSLIERVAAAPTPPRPSDVTLRKLEERIAAFGADIGPDEQVAAISVTAPAGASFFIQEREAISREMISLKGFDADGGAVEVVQHYSQFNVALMAVPKVPVRDGIGFTAGRSGVSTPGAAEPD